MMYKVVVIDDEDLFRSSLINKVKWENYNSSIAGEARTGSEALDLIYKVKPDIIICDIKMPVLDGLEVLKRLSLNDDFAWSKFIILSGYNDFEFTKTAIKFGAFDYILKPLKEEELIGVLIRAVDSLNTDANRQHRNLKSSIEIRKRMVERSESLLIHYTESRDLKSIYKYIDDFYASLPDPQTNEVYLNSISEFVFVTEKICDMFKLPKVSDHKLMSVKPDKVSTPLAVKAMFKEIIEELILSKNHEGKKIVKEVIEHINANYSQQISLELIARRYFINPSYFSQLFKSLTNENFSSYLTKKRIEKAKELLNLGTLKKYQIAEMVGYKDEKYFSQIFKKATSMTPSEYYEQVTKSNTKSV